MPQLTHRFAILYYLYVGIYHKVATLSMGGQIASAGFLGFPPFCFGILFNVYVTLAVERREG